jgi:hypothetical protein
VPWRQRCALRLGAACAAVCVAGLRVCEKRLGLCACERER